MKVLEWNLIRRFIINLGVEEVSYSVTAYTACREEIVTAYTACREKIVTAYTACREKIVTAYTACREKIVTV